MTAVKLALTRGAYVYMTRAGIDENSSPQNESSELTAVDMQALSCPFTQQQIFRFDRWQLISESLVEKLENQGRWVYSTDWFDLGEDKLAAFAWVATAIAVCV